MIERWFHCTKVWWLNLNRNCCTCKEGWLKLKMLGRISEKETLSLGVSNVYKCESCGKSMLVHVVKE